MALPHQQRLFDLKRRALIVEANRWFGLHEQGHNAGPGVEGFQRAVDGKARGEAWCMCYVQYCIRRIDMTVGAPLSWVFRSEHCMTVWDRTPRQARVPWQEVQAGDLMLWQKWQGTRATQQGHVAIVTQVIGPGIFATIEGNTGSGAGVQREGDGVFRKLRIHATTGRMRTRGYLRVWGPGAAR